MTQLFLTYIGVALPVSLLIAALALLRPWLQKRYSARLLCGLWLLAAVRLLLPVQLSLPKAAPVQLDMPQTEYVMLVDEEKLPQLAAPELPALPAQNMLQADYRQELTAYEQAAAAYETTMAAARRQAGRTVTLPQILCGVWLTGAAALALWQTAAYCYEKKRILRSAVLFENTALPQALGAELGLRRPVAVLQSAAVTSPLVLGIRHPQLVLPMQDYGEAELEMICRHELQHIRHGDILRKLVMNLAVLVHWYDPLVWLARHLAAQDTELACDEAVLAGRDAAYRAAYAQSILQTAVNARQKRQPLLSTGFACGKKTLKQRFAAIGSRIAKRRGRAILIGALCLVLAAGGIVAVTTAPAKDGETFPVSAFTGTDADLLTEQQLAALEGTRYWRTVFYRDPTQLKQWAMEQKGIDLSGGTEIWSQTAFGEALPYYRTGLAWRAVDEAQCAVMTPSLAQEMRGYATDTSGAFHYASPFDQPPGVSYTWQDCFVAVSPAWLEAAAIETDALPALRILQMTESAILLEMKPEWWEFHATQPSLVQLSRTEDGESWLVTEWSTPPPEDRWRDPARPEPETKTLGTWEGLTYHFVQGELQSTDENGILQWKQPVFSPTIEKWFYLPRLEMTGSDLLFFAAGQQVGCIRPNGELYLAAAFPASGDTLTLDHSIYQDRYVTLTMQTAALQTLVKARFDSFLMEWVRLDESGIAQDGSDLRESFGTMSDGLTELRRADTPEGVSGLVLKDIRHKAGRYLGDFTDGVLLPDDGIFAWTGDRLCRFSAADAYETPVEIPLPPDCQTPLRAVCDDGTCYLLYLANTPQGSTYGIAHYRFDGGLTAAASTGIAAKERVLCFLTWQDGLLTVQEDTTVNLTGEHRAHFTYDPADQTVREIWGE